MKEDFDQEKILRKKRRNLSMTFKAQELALWYDRDERGSNWNILSPTNSVAYSTLCVTPYHSESYLGFAGLTNLLYCVILFILTSVILFVLRIRTTTRNVSEEILSKYRTC